MSLKESLPLSPSQVRTPFSMVKLPFSVTQVPLRQERSMGFFAMDLAALPLPSALNIETRAVWLVVYIGSCSSTIAIYRTSFSIS